MVVGRALGWILLLLALAAAGYEAMAALSAGAWRPVALGDLWSRLHAASLSGAQAALQQHVVSWLWEPGITSILRLPGWAAFGAPAILLLWFCRRRTPERRFR